MKSGVWISFDLGLRGDYEGMYTWLDRHGAQECGDNFAHIREFEHRGELIAELKKDIEDSVDINRKTRIYTIFLPPDGDGPKGMFILGGRKAAPWSGYAVDKEQMEEDVI